MKCPNCNAETVDGAGFCPSCGHELKNDELIYCPNCGELTKAKASFCAKCGFKFQEKYKSSGVETRSVEFICGLIGSLIGIIVALIILSSGLLDTRYSGIILLTLSCIALASIIFLTKDRKVGGAVLIVVALILLANTNRFGFIELIFIAIAGLLAVFRK